MKSLIIIGGGAAGITAAISAKKHNPNLDVTLIERNEKLGKKISICGAGRCNVTNAQIDPSRFHGAPTKFIQTVLNQFDNKAIIKFLEDLGIELYEEVKNGRKKGKIFPITNQAATVVELLESEMNRLKIKTFLGCEIETISKLVQVVEGENEKFEKGEELNFVLHAKLKDEDGKIKKKIFGADCLIIAAGGKTYPRLGATGDSYKFAKQFGHNIIETVPSALALEAKHWMIPRLAGNKLFAEVTSIIDRKEIKTDADELMFAKYGLTGPVILNISRDISIAINRDNISNCKVRINFFPGGNFETIFDKFNKRWTEKSNGEVLHSLYGVLPNKFANVILDFLKIGKETLNRDLNKEQKRQIIETLTKLEVEVKKTKSWDEAEFTAGGVDTKEINAGTLESKIVSNLYFAGEALNVDGDVGGFNLSWAWSSGFVAGKGVAKC